MTTGTSTLQLENHADVFEERAENLAREDLLRWSAEFPHDSIVLQKLEGKGAKLLIGPRGCGKSTLLRRAYYNLLDTAEALPVYVNYSRSLALEPLFHRNANAIALFRQWVLMKVILGVRDTCSEAGIELPTDARQLAGHAEAFVDNLAKGAEPPIPDEAMSPNQLAARLQSWASEAGFSRCVLLMDDAAHAFSPQQQKEFFEIFRELRSRWISPKAAVYPGITEYSPYFNVGHEGEIVEAWANIEDDGYLISMRDVVSRRLPPELAALVESVPEIVDVLSLACFGLPRGLLNMLSEVVLAAGPTGGVRATWASAKDAIRANADATRSVFTSLAKKLARYRIFIELGGEMEASLCDHLRTYNDAKPVSQKAVAVGLKEPLSDELQKVIAFMEYAGLLRKMSSPVSRGVKGRFQRYSLHYSVVVSENVLSLGKRATARSTVEALVSRDAHAFPKLQPATILGSDFDQRCKIDLPPCGDCGALRIVQEARFCHSCGAELINSSVYHEALNASVDDLPIPALKKTRLKERSIQTVKHVMLADIPTLRGIRSVGSIWAARIKNAAEEHVSV